MKIFYLTFGQQSPLKNGFVLVVAETEMEARLKVIEQYGQKWSGLYSESNWDASHFPQGQLGVIE